MTALFCACLKTVKILYFDEKRSTVSLFYTECKYNAYIKRNSLNTEKEPDLIIKPIMRVIQILSLRKNIRLRYVKI